MGQDDDKKDDDKKDDDKKDQVLKFGRWGGCAERLFFLELTLFVYCDGLPCHRALITTREPIIKDGSSLLVVGCVCWPL